MTEQLTLPLFIFSQVFFTFPGSFPATYKPTEISFTLKTKSFEFMFPFQAIAWFLFSFSTQHLERGLLYLLSLTPHLSFSPALTLVSASGVGRCAHLSIEFPIKVIKDIRWLNSAVNENPHFLLMYLRHLRGVITLILTHSVHLTSSLVFFGLYSLLW